MLLTLSTSASTVYDPCSYVSVQIILVILSEIDFVVLSLSGAILFGNRPCFQCVPCHSPFRNAGYAASRVSLRVN